MNFQISDSFFHSVIDALNHDVIVVGNDDQILYVNIRAKSNLFKHFNREDKTAFALIMDEFQNIYSVKDISEVASLLEKTRGVSNFMSVNKIVTLKDELGLTRHVEMLSTPIYNSESGHLGRMWQFIDRTERVALEQMKDDFISIASHQLRTPLTGMAGYIDMIKSGDYGKVPSNLLEAFSAIETSAERMRSLIEDLLNISRLDKKKDTNDLASLEVKEVINDILHECDGRKMQKNVSVEVHVDEAVPILTTDRIKLYESLKNLIDNAIKYSKHGGKVAITANFNNNKVEISVRDSGIGIPEDAQKKLFTKFFRADNVLTEHFEGTGLGLYYVKNAIAELGGEVTFTSKVGQGTTFVVTLPVT